MSLARLSANVGVELRARLDAQAQAWGVSLSDALRRVAILGAGGDAIDAAIANEEALARRDAAADQCSALHPDAHFGAPSPRALRSSGLVPRRVVCVRIPSPWGPRIRAMDGGLRAALEAGAARLGLGRTVF